MVLPSNRKDKYDSIKKYLCVDCPTPSQCVLSRTLGRPQALMTVATKIALQMACKMGGELWSLEIPVSPSIICNLYNKEKEIGALCCGEVNFEQIKFLTRHNMMSQGAE